MNSNLNVTHSFTYKDLLLKKLYYSVICSVFSQLVLLQIYVLLSNVDIFHPLQWILTSLKTFTSFNTWLFVIPFLSIIFAQSIICAKDYVFKSNYCSTRFQKFISAFSMHNLVLLILHVLAGPMLIWLFLSLGGGNYQSLIKVTENKTYVLNEGSFFLILSGFWTGFYYFLKVYISEKHLAFPIIQQRKWLQLKAQMGPLLKESFLLSVWPTMYYIIIYAIWGSTFRTSLKNTLGLLSDENSCGILVNLYLWCFSAIYYFNMNLMKFFFNVFLTELVEFPLYKISPNFLNLQESILLSDLPIIQNLACLDLYTLSQWSPQRRQVFFTLSQPGGHPHNWNLLIENVLKLLKEYTDLLGKSTENKDVVKQPLIPGQLKSPLQSPDKFQNLRNMSLLSDPAFVDIVDVTHSNLPGIQLTETLFTKLKQKINNIINVTKVLLGIDFMFGELPQANIQKCLANGLIIIWTTQGISDLVCAALTEDKYGIVQKDIPGIVTTIVQLKQNLDKLNKVSALTKKVAGYDDFNYKMKGAITTALIRSLFNICRTYRNYMSDFPLSKDVSAYLYTICKS
ncbi:nucleoporin NDC1 [Diorhabda sublineata]|uniref:nucleoporin NDC1 n=1 Tax=Diorhabda sublineata TaxID=1163346 RepID=UPI0024E0912A|nr:nucleoporin NDC1 [Diorhabda sublineata]